MTIQELRYKGVPFINSFQLTDTALAGAFVYNIGGETYRFINGAKFLCLDYLKMSVRFVDQVTTGCLNQNFQLYWRLDLSYKNILLFDTNPGVTMPSTTPLIQMVLNNGKMTDDIWLNTMFENTSNINNIGVDVGDITFAAGLANNTQFTIDFSVQGYYLI